VEADEDPARSPRSARVAIRHLLALVVMATAATAFLWPVVSREAIFTTAPNTQSVRFPWAAYGEPISQVIQSDEANLSYPWHTLLTRSLRDEGELAFWNPHSFGGGVPLFSNGSSGQLAPVRLLTALTVSPVTAHEISAWLHLVAAGFATYLLLCELRARWWGALAAGVTWQSCGFVLVWLHLEVHIATFVFLPLTVALLHRAVRGRSAAAAVGAGVAAALLLISGHLLFALVSLIVAFGYALALGVERVRRSQHPRTELWRTVASIVVPGVLAVALAAVVLIPTFCELADSPREPITMDDHRVIGLPELGEVVLRVGWPDGLPLDADEVNYQPFIGLLGAAAALGGFVLRGRRGAGLARTLVVVGMAAAVGGPVMWVLHYLPVFDTFRPYGRFSLWSALGLVILVGHGVDATLAWLRRVSAERPAVPSWTPQLLLAVLILANTIQLLSWGRGANQTFWPRSPATVFPPTPVIEAAQLAVTPEGWPEMLVPVDRREPGDGYIPLTLGNEVHTVFGLVTTNGYDSTVPRRTSMLLRVLQGEDVDAVLAAPGRKGAESPSFESSRLRWDLLGRLGVGVAMLPPLLPPDDPSWGSPGRAEHLGSVRYGGPDGFLVEVLGAGPGPRLVAGTATVADDHEALRRLADSAIPADTVLVTPGELARIDGEAPSGGEGGRVVAATHRTNSSTVEVEVPVRQWLVLPVNWHAGWRAELDGDAVPVIRVDFQRLAVLVEPGRHTVELSFRPPGWRAGLVVSALSWLAVATAAAASIAPRPRTRTGTQTSSATV
jgi:hypothetical protein